MGRFVDNGTHLCEGIAAFMHFSIQKPTRHDAFFGGHMFEETPTEELSAAMQQMGFREIRPADRGSLHPAIRSGCYVREGDRYAPPLILINGWGQRGAATWHDLLLTFGCGDGTECRYRGTIVVTTLGEHCPKPDLGMMTTSDYADELILIIDYLMGGSVMIGGPRLFDGPMVIMSHSFGCVLSLHLQAQRVGNQDRLIWIAPPPFLPLGMAVNPSLIGLLHPRFWTSIMELYWSLFCAVILGRPFQYPRKIMEYLFAAHRDGRRVEFLDKQARSDSARVLVQALFGLDRSSRHLTEMCRSGTGGRLLIIRCGKDRVMPFWTTRYVQWLTGSRLTTELSKAAHCWWTTDSVQAREFAEVLAGHVQSARVMVTELRRTMVEWNRRGRREDSDRRT